MADLPRLLHVLGSLEVGGKERAALRLARRARNDGFDVSLLLFDAPYRHDDCDLDPAPIPWRFVQRAPGLDLRFVKRLSDYWTAQKIDVVHAHNDSAHVYAALANRLTFGGKPFIVTTLHTRPHHGGRRARFLMRNAAVGLPAINAVSRELAESVVADRWVRSCGVIVNGVDGTDFAPTGPCRDLHGECSIPAHHAIFAHVARFDPIKRHDDLLAAMHLLQDDECPITVVCIGRGPLLSNVRAQAAGLSNLRFIEFVSDMPKFLRSVDGVTLCSEHEATPLALLEAMACAKPLVATAVGGVPALFGESASAPTGLLVPPGRPDLLAAALARLARDGALRQTLGQRSYQQSGAFSFEREWAAYRAIYDGDRP